MSMLLAMVFAPQGLALLSALLAVVFSVTAGYGRSRSPRVLEAGEMAGILGGQAQYQNSCCTTDPDCALPTKHLCSQWGQYSCQRYGSQIYGTGNNSLGCVGTLQGTTCTETGNTDCLDYWPFCKWQASQGACVVNQNYAPSAYAYAPATCSPNCP